MGSSGERRDKTSVADRIGEEEGAPDRDAGTLHGCRAAKAHVSQDKSAVRGALEPNFPEPIGPTPFTQWGMTFLDQREVEQRRWVRQWPTARKYRRSADWKDTLAKKR